MYEPVSRGLECAIEGGSMGGGGVRVSGRDGSEQHGALVTNRRSQ